MRNYISIPTNISAFKNEEPLNISSIGSYDVFSEHNSIITRNNELYPQEVGQTEVLFKKGSIPVKKMNVNVLENKKIVTGGQCVGVKLQSLVVRVDGRDLVINC